MQDEPEAKGILLSPTQFVHYQQLGDGSIGVRVGAQLLNISGQEKFIHLDRQMNMIPLNRTDPSAVQQFTYANSSQYVVLHNPTKDSDKQFSLKPGSDCQSTELAMGQRVVLQGPQHFPLWPGQEVDVIAGHRLAEDEYLKIRAYASSDSLEPIPKRNQETEEPTNTEEATKDSWKLGEERIIEGSKISFYTPGNGWEVVPVGEKPVTRERANLHPTNHLEDKLVDRFSEDLEVRPKRSQRNTPEVAPVYVRQAEKPGDDEYCVLVDPDGNRTFKIGSQLVIPEPNQTFETEHGEKVRKATQLKPEEGLHLRIVKDIEVREGKHILSPGNYKVGQEVFISGQEGLVFPDENIDIVGTVSPIPIAENEGLYVLDKQTGKIKTVRGTEKQNLLIDPTKEELVTRTLPIDKAELYDVADRDPTKAVAVYVQPNRAILVVSAEQDKREVVVGSTTRVLDYTEDLEVLTLSTGTPKKDEHPLPVVSLQVEGNRVSDEVDVETENHVGLRLRLSYRINFEEEHKDDWFNEENYISLLCDHLSSIIRAEAMRTPLDHFYENSIDIVRDAILGPKVEGEQRAGKLFSENGMRVYDVEVLGLDVLDETVEAKLQASEREAFDIEMSKKQAETKFALTQIQTAIEQKTIALQQETETKQAEAAFAVAQKQEAIKQRTIDLEAATLDKKLEVLGKKRELETADAKLRVDTDKIRMMGTAQNQVDADRVKYDLQKEKADIEQQRTLDLIEARKEAFRGEVEAISPRLIEAAIRQGDQQTLIKAAEALGDRSALEGKSALEILTLGLQNLPGVANALNALRDAQTPEATSSDLTESDYQGQ